MRRFLLRAASAPAVIVAVSLAVRLWSLFGYTSHHLHQALGTIPFLFEPGNIAWSLANGHGFSSPFRVDTGPTAWMTPAWPALLAAIFRIFGNYTYPAFLAAAGVNVAFSALTCLPMYFAGERIGGRRAGAAAAWLWAIFPTAIVVPYESLWDTSSAALLMAMLLWSTLAIADSRHSGRTFAWYTYGLLWGAAIMTSASLASLLPFLIGWAAWRSGALTPRSFEKFEKPCLAASIAVLCCLPWTVRNYARFHELVPLRSVMGVSLFVGNNDHADGVNTAGLHPISNQTERNRYIELGEIAYMAEKRDEALAYMASHPARTMQLTAARFLAVWTGGSIDAFGDFQRGSPWSRWVIFCELAATCAALTGIVLLLRRRHPMAFPLIATVVVFPLPYYITIAPARYRHPLEPALLLLAAAAAMLICQTGESVPAPAGRKTIV